MPDTPAFPIQRRAKGPRRVPAVFLAHGSPLTILDEEFGTALRRFASWQQDLAALVVVSAHWDTVRPIHVTSSQRPTILHDYSGFPAWLGGRTYPCPGHPALASEIVALLGTEGIPAVLDPGRGLDHGVWVPLSLAYEHAKVPVVQISMPAPASPGDIVQIGRVLAPLRYKDVLLIGSGGIVHNLYQIQFDQPAAPTEPWAVAFDSWTREVVGRNDVDSLVEYRRRGPQAHAAAPTPDHFLPLLFVMGAALPGDRVHDIFEGFRYGTLSMRSFALTGRRKEDLRNRGLNKESGTKQ
jgi:4,5-DOPA dioxygenase extradiol